MFPAYTDAPGELAHVRGKGYDFSEFTRQFAAVRRALGALPAAGPALGGSGSGSGWSGDLGAFIVREPSLSLVTVHEYPLAGCLAPPSSAEYPTIVHLLSASATAGFAHSLAALVTVAQSHRLSLRVDELNSATCGGTIGVSNTFASALWALQTLFALDQAGVSGVNIHMFPGAHYSLFSALEINGNWVATVHPEYYGLLMFNQAAPPGSQLLPVNAVATRTVKIWATTAPDKTIRIVLINDDGTPQPLLLKSPLGTAGPATIEQLLAPSLTATRSLTIAGQSIQPSTTTGTLTGTPQTTTLTPVSGRYPITLPAASATMLTWPPAAARTTATRK